MPRHQGSGLCNSTFFASSLQLQYNFRNISPFVADASIETQCVLSSKHHTHTHLRCLHRPIRVSPAGHESSRCRYVLSDANPIYMRNYFADIPSTNPYDTPHAHATPTSSFNGPGEPCTFVNHRHCRKGVRLSIYPDPRIQHIATATTHELTNATMSPRKTKTYTVRIAVERRSPRSASPSTRQTIPSAGTANHVARS